MAAADDSERNAGGSGVPARDRTRFPLDLAGNRLYELHLEGVDLSRPIEVAFVVNFTDAVRAEAFRAAAGSLCDTVRSLDFAFGDAAGSDVDIDIVLRFDMVASHAAIGARETRIEALAREFGGRVTWYASAPEDADGIGPAASPRPQPTDET